MRNYFALNAIRDDRFSRFLDKIDGDSDARQPCIGTCSLP
jgi:hypothetical protein